MSTRTIPPVVNTQSSPSSVRPACCISTPIPDVTPFRIQDDHSSATPGCTILSVLVGTSARGVCSAPESRASGRLDSGEGCICFGQNATGPHWLGDAIVSSSIGDGLCGLRLLDVKGRFASIAITQQSPGDYPGLTFLDRNLCKNRVKYDGFRRHFTLDGRSARSQCVERPTTSSASDPCWDSMKDLYATMLLISYESLATNLCRSIQGRLHHGQTANHEISRRTTQYSRATASTDKISETLDRFEKWTWIMRISYAGKTGQQLDCVRGIAGA
ncbi:hypothetical protein P168DRAFT_302596 [Aspergillus campestris IBT 28561]|uniref:Uncharacterized protein n=1 Tax=Aspergillus campestris (strain IBT 28561) TaxID=1392248 RepID=A0A2I1D8N0_ASPC2|nr:uncharacterized protein P168DRAFT_302596 [Aspergillus campestris IBT 28561]PKY06217.1 hypothetical protein P168DRAFT_302596 [Aspergillus campestris IBT 28561]